MTPEVTDADVEALLAKLAENLVTEIEINPEDEWGRLINALPRDKRLQFAREYFKELATKHEASIAGHV